MIVPGLRAPVVLVHGLLGFGRLRPAGFLLADYFRGVPQTLSAGGNRVLVPSLSPTGAIADRARQLDAFLDGASPGEPVHLIAHSLGGLDARFLISRLGGAGRVLTLTTIGTPHLGTAFADWGIRRLQRFVRPVLEFGGVPYQAFFDLTTAACREFNERAPDAPGVRYYAVAGRRQRSWRTPLWELPGRIVERVEGANDGVVSVFSAGRGRSCEIWEGDHLDLVNWLPPLASGVPTDRLGDYVRLVRRLADEGF